MLKCARSLTFTQMIHAPKFILGFFHSTPARFPALKYRAPKFNYPPFLNLEMTSKQSLSSSRASSSDNSKVDVMKSGVLQDDSDIIEKSTVQGIKTRLRSSRVPAKGVKHELVSTLKSSMNINFDDEKVIRAEKKARTTGAEVCASVENSADEPWTVLTHRKPQKGWTAYNPRSMRPPPIGADKPHIKLMSWNVNGLRSLLKSGGFSAFKLAQREDFDVLCLQETKLKEKDVDVIRQSLLEGYDNSYWTCSVSKLGYSGTAIISRIKPHSVRYGLGIEDHDSEGRLVTVEFDGFYLLCGYVPNSGRGLKRLSYRVTEWDPSLSNYMKDLEKSKPVILSGDLNCAHQEIDIHNPDWNRRSAGFTDEERKSFETNFLERGFVDTFRRQHPDVVGYTFWGYTPGVRQTNKGWRLDYFLASESIADKVYDSYILPNVVGSDHWPIGLVLEL